MLTPATGNASLIGQTFAGYHVLGLVGRGAMGAVYLAEDVQLKRRVALKVLLGTLARNPAMVKNFQMEARAAAPLRHNNIVRVYNAGLEAGTPFMAMEYVEGEPLDRFLRRKGHMPWQTALFIGQQVAEALACAHDHGLVHRDVKPGNILLDGEGRARLSDFGIANVTIDGETAGPQGAFVGTPHYMSPEQCSGKKVGQSSDLFSLGVMLYRMISGKLPFQSDDPMELIRKIAYEDPQRLNRVTVGIPDDVARLVAHLLQKDPAKRPESAATVASMIKRLQAEQGGQSALPAALTAFVREEAEIRPVTHGDGTRRRPTGAPQKRTSSGRETIPFDADWIGAHARAIGLTILAAVCALTGSQIALAMRPTPEISGPPVVGALTPAAGHPGTQAVVAASDAFVLRDFSFYDPNNVVVVAEGRAGTRMNHGRGLMRLDLDEGVLYSVRAPMAPATDITSPVHSGVARAYAGITAPGMLVALHSQRASQLGLHVQPYSQSVTKSEPAYLLNMPQGDVSIEAVASMGNHTTILARSNDSDRLLELGFRSNKQTVREVARADAGAIIPESVQYDNGDTWVSYMIEAATGRRELWVAPSGGATSQPVLLTLGELGARVAFSTDSELVAYSATNREGLHEIHTIHIRSLRDIPGIGLGRIIENGWSSADDMIYALHTVPGSGVRQLVRIDPSSGVSEPITSFPRGLGTIAALSPDGRYVITNLAGDRPHIVLVDLREVSGATTPTLTAAQS